MPYMIWCFITFLAYNMPYIFHIYVKCKLAYTVYMVRNVY